jgi:DNA-binding transcriptional LysR family regulator
LQPAVSQAIMKMERLLGTRLHHLGTVILHFACNGY